jgi:hypothetical protein
MDEALILKKLDDLSNEVRTFKSEVLEELRQELKPAKPAISLFEECLAETEGGHTKEDLTHLVKNLLANVEMLNSLLGTIKGAMELKEEIEPIAKQAYPMAIEAIAEVSENLDMEQVKPLIRNTLGNLENFNTVLNMLKAGMELKDEIEPIAKLAYPMAIETIAEVSENLDMEQVKPLIRNTLSNLENFNTALNMLKAGMELKDEIEPLAKLAYPMAIETIAEISENLDMEQVRPLIRNALGNLENFNTALIMMKAGMELKDDIEPLAKLSLPVIIDFFTSISGLMKVSGTALGTLKDMRITPEQAESMGKVIQGIDLGKSNKVGVFGMIKKLNEPTVQEALGAAFYMLEVLGSLLQAYRGADKS